VHIDPVTAQSVSEFGNCHPGENAAARSTAEISGKNGDSGSNPVAEEHQVLRSVIGEELSAADLAKLEARWLDRHVVVAACLRRVDSFIGSQLVGRRGGDYAGIAIPYFSSGSVRVREYRLRRDHPELEVDSTGQLKVRQKISVRRDEGICSICRPAATLLR
jgi:hypothetical protein